MISLSNNIHSKAAFTIHTRYRYYSYSFIRRYILFCSPTLTSRSTKTYKIILIELLVVKVITRSTLFVLNRVINIFFLLFFLIKQSSIQNMARKNENCIISLTLTNNSMLSVPCDVSKICCTTIKIEKKL